MVTMPAERQLPASILVPALIRQVNGAGGFATILGRGGPFGSALILVHRRAEAPQVIAYERLPALDEHTVWHAAATGEEAVESFVRRQRRFDPDLWVVELDIADPARFVPGFPPVD